MSSRDRIVAIAVGSLVVLILGYVAFSWVSSQFTTRSTEIARLEGEIKKFKRVVFEGDLAKKKIGDYAERSLPANPEITHSLYTDWLLDEVENAGMQYLDVSFMAQTTQKNLCVKQSFNVTAQGTLPQVVNFLHAFYSVDWLHRISYLSLVPYKGTKLLSVTMKIDALSFRKAKDVAELDPRPGSRLLHPTRQAYHNAIVNRNLFGPPNNPPTITVSGVKDVFLGRSAELTVKGTDPDGYDTLWYQLVQSPDSDAKFDEEKGVLTWSPKAEGKYEFTFQAFDDGFPSKWSEPVKVVINVKPQAQSRPILEFDDAKYTVLTAVIDLNGKGEVWLHVRPKGQMVIRHQGEQFEIGSVKGTVAEIGQHDFCFTCEGKLRKLGKGDFLEQAKVIGDAPTPTAAEAVGAENPDEPKRPAGVESQVNAEARQSG